MTRTIYVDRRDIPGALLGAYNGRKIRVVASNTIPPIHSQGWDGDGSRDSYARVNLATGARTRVTRSCVSTTTGKISSVPGYVIVRHCIYRGQDVGLYLYIHPDNLPDLNVTQEDPTHLSPLQEMILYASCAYKPRYLGKDRFDMVQSDFPQVTRADWDAAKADLQTLGLLTHNGAVTIKGRNRAPVQAPKAHLLKEHGNV
jgi:hypothetical protein